MLTPWKGYEHIKKQRHYFAKKGPSSQGYGFTSGHVWLWELDYKENWVPNYCCFWTVVLEKTLENPLDYKEIQPVNPKGNLSWILIGRTGFWSWNSNIWPPNAKNWLIWKDPDAGKDWRQEKKEMTEDEMVGWHHWFNRHEFEKTTGVVMDREVWRTAVHRVAKSQTWLSDSIELNTLAKETIHK